MTPWIYGTAGAALGGVLLGWTVRDWKADADLLDAQNDAQAAYRGQVESNAEWSSRYDYLVQDLRSAERTNNQTIRTIYRDIEVPGECAVPSAAVSVLDNAIERANAATAGQSVKPVSGTSRPTDASD